jgi:hypothetical protein
VTTVLKLLNKYAGSIVLACFAVTFALVGRDAASSFAAFIAVGMAVLAVLETA